jgi:hypothetical protein
MSEELPDWLRDIAPDDEEEDEFSIIADELPDDVSDDELMDSLRTELDETEEALYEPEVRQSGSGVLDFLLPWQRFVLSVFLFLDVLVIGLLFLTMLGRISMF